MTIEEIFFNLKIFMGKENISFFLIKEELDFFDSDSDIILKDKTGLKNIISHFRSFYKAQIINERSTYNQYYVIVKDDIKVHAFDFSIGLIIKGTTLIDPSLFFNNKRNYVLEEYRLKKVSFKSNKKQIRHHLVRNLKFNIQKLFTNKKGKLIVFIGVDGSGKSTIIEDITSNYSRKRKLLNIIRYHFRPKVIKGSFLSEKEIQKAIKSPHSSVTLNTLKSFMKVLFIVLNYMLFLPTLYLNIFLGRVIIFDRFYTDLFFDQKRYRLNKKGTSLAKLLNFIIPKPDRFFFIMGRDEVIYERKKEITLNEISKIQNKYIDFIKKNPEKSIVIHNNFTKEKALLEANKKFISIL